MLKKILIFLLLSPLVIYAQTEDVFNKFRLGQSYEQAGNYQKAEEIYESLYNSEPLNIQFFEALNRIYIQLKKYDASIKIIEKRLSFYPEDINMYGLLGNTLHQKGEEEKAYEVWDKGLNAVSQTSINYRVIANYAIERRAFEKAVEILQKGKTISNDIYSFSFEIANLYAVLMRFKEAAEEYCYILSKDPNQVNVVENRMTNYINKPGAFNITVEVVENRLDKEESQSLQLLLAWLYMENNDYGKAYDTYLKIEKKGPEGAAELLNFAQKALTNGFYNEAAKAFKRIIEKYPDAPYTVNAKIGYSKTLETEINKKNDDLAASWKPYTAKLSGKLDDYAEVISAYEQLIESNKNNINIAAESYYRIGQIKLKRLDDVNGAEETFQQLLNVVPVSDFRALALLSLAEISIIKNNIDEAASYFKKILNIQLRERSGKNYSAYMLARIEFWKGSFVNASRELNIVTGELSDNIANDAIELSLLINTTKNDSLNLVKFAKADLLAEQKQFKEASAIYQELSKIDHLLTLKDLSAFRHAQMVTMSDDLPAAVTLLEEISNKENGNIYADKALLLLGKIYQFGIKDLALAKKSYEKLLANFPNSLYLDDARENITVMKIN